MTLDEVSRAGDLVTESLDDDANVIWGARINNDMKGKIAVMTIMTGVKGSNLLGRANKEGKKQRQGFFESELGIELV